MSPNFMKHVYGWLLLTPAAILLIAFTHYPTVATIFDSLFSKGTAIRPSRFVGLANYEMMIEDPIFWKVLTNNAWFAIGTIPTSIVLAIVMALMANRALPGRSLVRIVGENFPKNRVFIGGHNWLGDPATVLPSIIVMTVWKEAGFFMIFYLAALQNISPELEEAARLEGSTRWYYFRRVLFPLLMPTSLFVMVNAVLNSFKLVDHLFVLTKGGPDNASNLLLFYIFESAFSYFDTNYAATLTVVLLGLLAVMALMQFYFLDKRVHYR